VLDVQPKLAARVRLLHTGKTGKNDPNDALSAAVAALRSAAGQEVIADGHARVLRVWAKRHRDLSRARNQAVCRLHALLCELIPGGVADEITAGQATRLRSQISPSGAVAQARCELAAELLADIRHLDARRREARTKLAAAVKAPGTSLTEISGAGPVIAATVIGDVVTVARFPTRDHFAAYNGTAPVDVSSGERKIYRLPLRGNRRHGHAIHMAAITRSGARTATAAPATSARSPGERPTRRHCGASNGGSATPSTRGCAPTPAQQAREGNRGTTLSPGRPAHTPSASSSDKPLPGLRPAYAPRQHSHRPCRRAAGEQNPAGHLTTTTTKRIRSVLPDFTDG
jgi:hypothetical protein